MSLVVWANLMRFLVDGPVAVAEFATNARFPQEHVKAGLGCLERWGFVTLESTNAGELSSPPGKLRVSRGKRDGWGSGRGIRGDWRVVPTVKGLRAIAIWAPLEAEIERRWRRRFAHRRAGEAVRVAASGCRAVRGRAAARIAGGDLGSAGARFSAPRDRSAEVLSGGLSLSALLSRRAFAFANDFDREAGVSLGLCANAIRVLGGEPVREAEIPRLTGCSPETSGIGWQLRPYIVVEADPEATRASRAGCRRSGSKCSRNITCSWRRSSWNGRTDMASGRWEICGRRSRPSRTCATAIARVCRRAWCRRRGSCSGGRGAGASGVAMWGRPRERARDLVAQSEAFVRDPLGALPHFPLWDMNRGYGP